MAVIGQKNRRGDSERQGWFPHVARERDDVLLTLDEVVGAWEVTVYAVYKAVRDGDLRRVRRRGYQPYYTRSDVVAWLKREPTNEPPLNPVKNGESSKGG